MFGSVVVDTVTNNGLVEEFIDIDEVAYVDFAKELICFTLPQKERYRGFEKSRVLFKTAD